MSERDDEKSNGFDTEDEKRRPPREKNEEAQIGPDGSEKDDGFPIEAET